MAYNGTHVGLVRIIAIIEDATPEMVKRAFLNVNHTGQPMSKEHIEFVKSINI